MALKNKRLAMLLLIYAALALGLSSIALAQDESANEPLWFKLLEPLGIVIGIMGLVYSYSNFRHFGGQLGKSYKYIMGMLALFILAFILRSLAENGIIGNGLATEVIFELLLYAGVVMVAIASKIAQEGFRKA